MHVLRAAMIGLAAVSALCLTTLGAAAGDESYGALKGVEVFPFEGETEEERSVGVALSAVLDRALGNLPTFQARLRQTGHLRTILRSAGLDALQPAGPEAAAGALRRADETAAVCGTVRREGEAWRVVCSAYDAEGRALGPPTESAGSLREIEASLPQVGRALAAQLRLSALEAKQVQKWCQLPQGWIEGLVSGLARSSWRERLGEIAGLVERYPDFSVPYTLAMELYLIGDEEMAEVGPPEPYDELRDRAQERFGDRLDVLCAVTGYSLARNHLDIAEESARRVRTLCPSSVAAQMALATVAEREGRFTEGIGLRRLIVSKQPKSASAAYELARSLLWRARTVRHGYYFSQMTEENQTLFARSVEEALTEAQQAAALDPDRGDIWALVFQCAMENGDDELAVQALDSALDRMPYGTDLWSDAWYYFSPGYTDDRNGWMDLQRRLLKARPGSFAELYRMARALDDYRMGFMGADTEVIMELFRRALALRPDSGPARADYVQALLAGGEVEEGAREFAKLKEGEGVEKHLYHLTHGLLLRAQGDTQGAIEAFRQSKESGTGYFWNVRCDNYIAESYVHEGDFGAAQEILESVYSTWMHFDDVNYLLAYVYHKQGNDADALGVLSDLEPQQREAMWVTATVPASEYPVSDITPPTRMPEPPNSDVPKGWRLVFHDEFEGDELLPDWTVRHGEWIVRKGALWATGGEEFQLIAAPGEYGDVHIEFQMMCESSGAWAGAFLLNPGDSLGGQLSYLRFLSWGGAELFNIHQANRVALEDLPTMSPGDWWWVRVQVKGRDAAAWISQDRRHWVCADWGQLKDPVPERGRILLSVREGQQRAAFRHLKIFAPPAG